MFPSLGLRYILDDRPKVLFEELAYLFGSQSLDQLQQQLVCLGAGTVALALVLSGSQRLRGMVEQILKEEQLHEVIISHKLDELRILDAVDEDFQQVPREVHQSNQCVVG